VYLCSGKQKENVLSLFFHQVIKLKQILLKFHFAMAIDIVEYLNHLLHRNNVAILPGLGAFIAAPTPAVIDHARGILHPPSKVISFNENLKMNDGFLINHIRNQHGITASDARTVVENFVRSVEGILASGESVLLDKIGKLYINSQGRLVFEPDGKTNFNPATFGLPEVKYHPIDRRVTNTEKTNTEAKAVSDKTSTQHEVVAEPLKKENIAEPIPTISTPLTSWMPSRKTSLLAAGLFGATLLTAIYMYKSKPDLEIENPAIQVSENRLNVKPSKEAESTEITPSENKTDETNNVAVAPTEKTVEKVTPAPIEKTIVPETLQKDNFSSEKSSTVVFLGSFSSERNAKRTVRRLKRKGFEVYREKHNGLRRIGTPIEFSSEKEKSKKINSLRRIFGRQCWTK
jgi:nucleoid DNA-binding protein/cell division septation protein DedD